MTNRESKINAMIALWGDLIQKKEKLVREMWTIETKLSNLKQKINEYGASKKIPRMDQNTTEIDPMADLDRSFAYDGGGDLQ